MFQMCNGTIAGMVAICAGANTVYPWAAWVIGFIGGIVYKCWSMLVANMGIDDPLDAAAVSSRSSVLLFASLICNRSSMGAFKASTTNIVCLRLVLLMGTCAILAMP